MKKALILIVFSTLLLFLINFEIIKALKFKDVSSFTTSSSSTKGLLIKKDERETVTVTDSGQISSLQISDGFKRNYHLQFITLEPNSLFLPVLLHSDMVFYVHTGVGSLSWIDEEKKNKMNLERGDIGRIPSGSVFYIRSSLESSREKLRVYAIFTDTNIDNPQDLSIGAYSTLTDLVLGFDKKVNQVAFQVSEEVIDEITRATRPKAIVHMTSKSDKLSSHHLDWKAGIFEALIGTGGSEFSDEVSNNKKKKTKNFNILNKKPDFSNCNGWSVAVNSNDYHALKGSDVGVFMVNLTKGSMMGPHWNPRASEIAIVTHGQGMINVVCSSITNETECKSMRFKVEEGDVFAVPRFHPMAQMSYNNDSLVFMGFSTNARKNHPQFLAGKSSVFRTLDSDVLAMSFNVPNTTLDSLLSSQAESIILECVSCAEEEEEKMKEEIQREKEEEEKREREEEEARRREEEAKEKEREERKREEEERRKQKEEEEREEEERRKQEEEQEREEEERRKQEEEKAREEERRKQKEEEEREEEERRKQEEEEEREEEERREEERRQEEKAREEERRQEEARREEEERAREEEEREEAERARREEEREEEEAEREEEREREREEEDERRQEEREGDVEARRVLRKMRIV